MGTSIRISDGTMEKLERIKRPDESFDDLLSRLAALEEIMRNSAGAWSGTDNAEGALQAREELRESFRVR